MTAALLTPPNLIALCGALVAVLVARWAYRRSETL